jgi:hypothetical protein
MERIGKEVVKAAQTENPVPTFEPRAWTVRVESLSSSEQVLMGNAPPDRGPRGTCTSFTTLSISPGSLGRSREWSEPSADVSVTGTARPGLYRPWKPPQALRNWGDVQAP